MYKKQEFRVSVAPMMDWTDRHCRFFHRQLSRRAWLYTEMVVADAVIHGPRDRLLGFHACEHPVALQIGGSDPQKLAEAAQIGEQYGYDEININIGCPSDRVQSGRFGACLMEDPDLVARCYTAMQNVVSVPVSVKCRLGVDDQDIENTLPDFLTRVNDAGCKMFIIHARKAWLQGLSPKDNRTVPPLQYEVVHTMKSHFPNLRIELNGGLESVSHGLDNLGHLDGLMFGRAAYNDPWMLTQVDHALGQGKPDITREDIVDRLIVYAQSIEVDDISTKALIRHVMGLYHGQTGARVWRRSLSEGLGAKLTPSETLRRARDAREACLSEVLSA